MKKTLIALLLLPVFVLAQTAKSLDFIAPFSNDVAAVKKGNSWAFINDKGIIVIPFRDDLVLTKTDGYQYPIFKNNRCLISEKRKGILYFGYIDKTGKTVIEPQFLNASTFSNDKAIALKILKDTIGTNDILDKSIVRYKYFEIIIDADGSIKEYLNPKGTNFVLDEKFLRKPPLITSKFISNNLVAILNKNNKWTIIATNN